MRTKIFSGLIAVFTVCLPCISLADGEMTEQQSIQTLMSWLKNNAFYEQPFDCLKPKSLGYKNRGYTIEIMADCPGIKPGLLGRWRIDTLSTEIFEQNNKGKYLAPRIKAQNTPNSPPVVREETEVTVGQTKEIWRLEWLHPPKQVCMPDDEMWYTCPCEGFAFGEDGELDLVRKSGNLEERLHLTAVFNDMEKPGEKAVLQRWPVFSSDTDNLDQKLTSQSVQARPTVTAMKLADYDHDGKTSEFVLQVGAIPCGHQQSVLVGVSSQNPRLHVFGTVEHPDHPLVLEHPGQWQQLPGKQESIILPQWTCGDHGSEEQSELTLQIDARGLHATQQTYKCTESGEKGALVSKEVL